ncbi:hypothetical protein EDC54_11553 [Samsonia erythrinae]|uniref:Uncharacterized protein n=1 Tax=Samsonia erythrinae TaxID=160434 RepID=A0A4R3VHU1_9GAMM|nr:hypothetical protein EDC54_11553 [Samsonia erythrinae]
MLKRNDSIRQRRMRCQNIFNVLMIKRRFYEIGGIASREQSTLLSVYNINQDNGNLMRARNYPTGKGANWGEIVKLL